MQPSDAIVPAWTVWPGKNHFYFAGRVIGGPTRLRTLISLIVLVFSSAAVAGAVASDIGPASGLAIACVLCSGLLSACFLAKLHFSDPGIVPRAPLLFAYVHRRGVLRHNAALEVMSLRLRLDDSLAALRIFTEPLGSVAASSVELASEVEPNRPPAAHHWAETPSARAGARVAQTGMRPAPPGRSGSDYSDTASLTDSDESLDLPSPPPTFTPWHRRHRRMTPSSFAAGVTPMSSFMPPARTPGTSPENPRHPRARLYARLKFDQAALSRPASAPARPAEEEPAAQAAVHALPETLPRCMLASAGVVGPRVPIWARGLFNELGGAIAPPLTFTLPEQLRPQAECSDATEQPTRSSETDSPLPLCPKWCWECHMPRYRATTGHCSECGNCVEHWDHHCGWAGTCIGAGNYCTYISCLCAHLSFTITLIVVCAMHLVRLIRRHETIVIAFQASRFAFTLDVLLAPVAVFTAVGVLCLIAHQVSAAGAAAGATMRLLLRGRDALQPMSAAEQALHAAANIAASGGGNPHNPAAATVASAGTSVNGDGSSDDDDDDDAAAAGAMKAFAGYRMRQEALWRARLRGLLTLLMQPLERAATAATLVSDKSQAPDGCVSPDALYPAAATDAVDGSVGNASKSRRHAGTSSRTHGESRSQSHIAYSSRSSKRNDQDARAGAGAVGTVCLGLNPHASQTSGSSRVTVSVEPAPTPEPATDAHPQPSFSQQLSLCASDLTFGASSQSYPGSAGSVTDAGQHVGGSTVGVMPASASLSLSFSSVVPAQRSRARAFGDGSGTLQRRHSAAAPGAHAITLPPARSAESVKAAHRTPASKLTAKHQVTPHRNGERRGAVAVLLQSPESRAHAAYSQRHSQTRTQASASHEELSLALSSLSLSSAFSIPLSLPSLSGAASEVAPAAPLPVHGRTSAGKLGPQMTRPASVSRQLSGPVAAAADGAAEAAGGSGRQRKSVRGRPRGRVTFHTADDGGACTDSGPAAEQRSSPAAMGSAPSASSVRSATGPSHWHQADSDGHGYGLAQPPSTAHARVHARAQAHEGRHRARSRYSSGPRTERGGPRSAAAGYRERARRQRFAGCSGVLLRLQNLLRSWCYGPVLGPRILPLPTAAADAGSSTATAPAADSAATTGAVARAREADDWPPPEPAQGAVDAALDTAELAARLRGGEQAGRGLQPRPRPVALASKWGARDARLSVAEIAIAPEHVRGGSGGGRSGMQRGSRTRRPCCCVCSCCCRGARAVHRFPVWRAPLSLDRLVEAEAAIAALMDDGGEFAIDGDGENDTESVHTGAGLGIRDGSGIGSGGGAEHGGARNAQGAHTAARRRKSNDAGPGREPERGHEDHIGRHYSRRYRYDYDYDDDGNDDGSGSGGRGGAMV